MKTDMLRKVEEAYLHSLLIKEHQVLETLFSRLTAVHRESLEQYRELELVQRRLEVDRARQRQLDISDRRLDRDHNSDHGTDFDSKQKMQTRCAWSGGTLSLGSRGLDYVKTEYLLDALGIHSRADPGPISWSLTAWSGTLANTAPLSSTDGITRWFYWPPVAT